MGSDPVGSGPMCPFRGNTVRFSPMGREFGMSTTGGHIGPPYEDISTRYMNGFFGVSVECTVFLFKNGN